MLTLPCTIATVLKAFAPLFSKHVFAHVRLLVIGAILAPGKRTVTSVLRVMGKGDDPHFQNYHRVLNRARWPALRGGRILLQILLHTFAPAGPVVLGIDETIERRRGEKIAAKGIYRDPVRSSHAHFVKASGLRWVSLMLLTPITWTTRVWALPFLTVLAPSER
jgi:DDE superfamily endonuclease